MSVRFKMTERSVYHGSACQATKEYIFFLRNHLSLTEREYRDLRKLLKTTVSQNMKTPDNVSSVHVGLLRHNIAQLKNILIETAYTIAQQREKYTQLFSYHHHVLDNTIPLDLSCQITFKHRKNHGLLNDDDLFTMQICEQLDNISNDIRHQQISLVTNNGKLV